MAVWSGGGHRWGVRVSAALSAVGGIVLGACSQTAPSEPPPEPPRVDALEVARGAPELQRVLSLTGGVKRVDDGFVSAARLGIADFRATVPTRADGAVRLERAGADPLKVAIVPIGRSKGATPRVSGSAIAFDEAEQDADVVHILRPGRYEELRILRTPEASGAARYRLELTGGTARARDGAIEIVDRSGRVAFRTLPAWAQDATGRRRAVKLTLEPAARGGSAPVMVAALDLTGLKFPTVIDPSWVSGPSFPSEVVVALNSAWLRQNSVTTGNVAVIDASAGPVLSDDAEAVLGIGATLAGTLKADSIRLKSNATLSGDASFNDLVNNGTITGSTTSPLSLPLAITVPEFPSFTAGTTDVIVNGGDDQTLAAGAHRVVQLKAGSASDPTVLTLSGGVYNLDTLNLGDRSKVECAAACEVRIKQRLEPGQNAYIGPAAGSGLTAANVELFVEGINGSSGNLGATPNAATIGFGNEVRARIFAPNGTLLIKDSGTVATGTFVALDVQVGIGVQVTKDVPSACTSGVDDGNPCTIDSCDESTGTPIHDPAPAGASCSDGNACNGSETCDGAGACQAGAPLTCDDGNPCTSDACNPATGCATTPLAAGTSCADADACNGNETCDGAGVCQSGSPLTCDDGNPCTTDACSPSTGCTATPVASGTSCADGDACNGAETCDGAGACAPGTPLACDDGNSCTSDACNPSTGCTATPVAAGTSCADADVCNGDETCDGAGVCQGGTPLTCDDGNPCTSDACNPSTGCTTTPVAAGTSCADADACNGAETCDGAGVCQAGTPLTCDDGNPCTANACSPSTGCTTTPVAAGTSCADTDACNGAETCDGAGVCQGGTPLTCDDGNPCTSDACNPSTGCTTTPVTAGTSCGDGDACNGDEACDASATCQPGEPPVVDDGNICTIDSCDPSTGVSHVPISGCDPTGTTAARYESRASVLGRMVDLAGQPVTGFTVTILDQQDADVGIPRSDVVVTTEPDGSFRARLTAFPESALATTPPTRVLVKVESADLLDVFREVSLRPGDAIDLGDLVALGRDSTVTFVGPEGGTATNSTGTIEIVIPPGALAAPVPIRMTAVPARNAFPFPLPPATATGYGIVLEPAGTQFATPATLRIANTKAIPTSLSIPVGIAEPLRGRWTHQGFALWDGERFTTPVPHFTLIDVNPGNLGELVMIASRGGDARRSPAGACGASSIAYGSGGLRQRFKLLEHYGTGAAHGVTVTYDSALAASLGFGPEATSSGVANPSGLRIPIGVTEISYACVAPGGGSSAGCSVGQCLLGGFLPSPIRNKYSILGSTSELSGEIAPGSKSVGTGFYVDLPQNSDGTLVASGYQAYHHTVEITAPLGGSGACVGGGATFGVEGSVGPPQTASISPGPQLDVYGYELLYHRRASPLGAGWGVAELSELFRSPSGHQADLVDGDGVRETFLPNPVARVAGQISPPFRTALTRDAATGKLYAAHPQGQIREVALDGSQTVVWSGSFPTAPVSLAVATVGGQRHFAVALEDRLLEIDPSGSSATLAVRSGLSTDRRTQPHVAASGKYVYYTSGENPWVNRVALDDPARQVTAITAASGGEILLDPESPAGGVAIGDARGLAAAPDGALYVASMSRNVVYRLAPEPGNNAAGPTSSVTRVVGSGQRSLIVLRGTVFPGPTFVVAEPIQLALSPDGTLAIVNPFGAALYDPQAKSARWLEFDSGTPSGDASYSIFNNGSVLAMGPATLWIMWNGEIIEIDASLLRSEQDPTRSIAWTPTGATFEDSTREVRESWAYTDEKKDRLVLTSRTRLSGEPLLTLSYQPTTWRLASMTDPSGRSLSFSYGSNGKLTQITDGGGRTVSVQVDASGDLKSFTLPSGEQYQFNYQGHRMTTATDPRGQQSVYTYASSGAVETATRPGGGTLTASPAFAAGTFDANGNLVYVSTMIDDRGVSHEVTLDRFGQVVRDAFTADGQSYDVRTHFATTLLGSSAGLNRKNSLLRASHTSVNGLQVTPTLSYDSRGRLFTEINAPGSLGSDANKETFRWSFDANGLLSELRPSDTLATWKMERDSSGRPVKLFDAVGATPTGRQTLFAWRPDGQLDSLTAHGVATNFGYDAPTGMLTSAVDGLGRSLTITRDAAGNPVTIDDGTTTVALAHDASNRLTSLTDAAGNTTTFGYANAGCACAFGDRVTSLATPDLAPGQKWSFGYDADGRLNSVLDPKGGSESYQHTAQGDLATFTDRLGRTTQFTYDSLGRPATTLDPAGRAGVFGYPTPTSAAWVGPSIYAGSPNASPAPTSLTAALASGQYQIGLNAHRPGGMPAQIEFYRDATIQLGFGRQFDNYGRLIRRADRTGLSFASSTPFAPGLAPHFWEQFAFDNNSPFPVLRVAESLYSTAVESGVFTRNAEFDVSSDDGWTGPFNRPKVQRTYTRDAGGRVTGVAQTFNFPMNPPYLGTLSLPSSTTYASNGQVVSETINFFTRTFTYNNRGLVESIAVTHPFSDGGSVFGNTEGTFSFAYDSMHRNVNVTYPDGHMRTQQWDELGRLTSRCYEYPGVAPTRCYTAQYDAVGNPTVLTDPEGTSTITYDALDRVTSVTRTSPGLPTEVESYVYNALGGFSTYDSQPVDDQRPRLDGGGTAPSAIPASVAGQNVTADAAGRITFASDAIFDFNKRNRLVKITSPGYTTTHGYDAELRRIGTTRDGDSVVYSYDGPNIVAASSSARPEPMPSFWFFLYEGTDQPLWMYDDFAQVTIYYELDIIGNVRRLRRGTDFAGFHPHDLGGYRYSAFGKLRPSDTTTPHPTGQLATQPLRWQARWHANTAGGVYEFRNRTWLPAIGSFLEPDEYEFFSTEGTLWSWPGQNAVRFRDPSGRASFFGGISVGGGLFGAFGSYTSGFVTGAGGPSFFKNLDLGFATPFASSGFTFGVATGDVKDFTSAFTVGFISVGGVSLQLMKREVPTGPLSTKDEFAGLSVTIGGATPLPAAGLVLDSRSTLSSSTPILSVSPTPGCPSGP